MKVAALTILLIVGLTILSTTNSTAKLIAPAVSVERSLTTRFVDAVNYTKTPDQVTKFLTTDEKVWVWFKVNSVSVGDTAYIEWYKPGNSLYVTQHWNPTTFSGDGWFWTSVNIANSPPASLPGTWSAKVYYNNTLLIFLIFTIDQPTNAGAVVIDGTDANDHGSVSNGVNQTGWLYMQRVLESLARQVPAEASKTVVSLGAGGKAYDALSSAFNLSSLPRNGWELIALTGEYDIGNWLDQLSTTNTGILYLTTYNLVESDFFPEELAAVNAHAAQIAKYVNGVGTHTRGGALFAMSEVNTNTNVGAWEWLQSLFPGIVVTSHGTDGIDKSITLTYDGAAVLPGITNTNLAPVRPWHNSFTFVQGRLKILGTAPDNSNNTRQVILGGLGGDVFATSCILSSSATVSVVGDVGKPVSFVGAHALSNCAGSPVYEWDFGDSSAHSAYPNTQHIYSKAGVYNWKLSVNLAGAGASVKTGIVYIGLPCLAPLITTQPDSILTYGGRTATISVKLGGGTQPFTYQWYRGVKGDISKPIIGATFASYTTPPLTSDASYWVRVTSDCGESTDSQMARVSVIAPGGFEVDVFDPACRSLDSCSGDYLVGDASSVKITNSLDSLLKVNVTRSGVVADGVTRLLLRVYSASDVTFTLRRPGPNFDYVAADSKWGKLTLLDGTTQGDGTSIKVSPLGSSPDKVAFAVYQSPLDIPEGSVETEFYLQVTVGAETRIQRLTLHRPPVVMVHGVWSKSDVWLKSDDKDKRPGLEPYLKRAGYSQRWLTRVDYSCKGCDKSDPNYGAVGSFDPAASNIQDQFNVVQLISSVREALAKVRQSNIAVTQVDIVAHSMGGLIARSRAARETAPGQYKRLVNYFKGDFHKLITIGTPHQGTPLADWLLARRCQPLVAYKGVTLLNLEQVFSSSRVDKPLGAAIYGFQTSSEAINHIPETKIPSHAIYAIAPKTSQTESFLDWATKIADINGFATIDKIFKSASVSEHDTIVPVKSQRGGLEIPKATEVENVIHADLKKSEDIGETESEDVWYWVVDLLSTATNSDRFGNFSNFKGTGIPAPLSFPPTPCQSLSFSEESIIASSEASLEPGRNSVFRPGETVLVTLTVTGGNKTDGAIFFFDGQVAIVDGSSSISYSFVAPNDRAGKIEITAFTLGPGPDNYLGATEIFVLPATPPASITATPNNLLLSAIGESRELEVTGLFASQLIDITSSQAGTTYSVKSGTTSIISVSANGMITARGFGRDSIIVSNAGKTAVVNVLVSQTEQTANLPVTSVSSASYLGTSLSPESIVAAFGSNFAETVELASSIPLPTSLASTTVKVRDSVETERLAPLFFVSPNQINYQIPPGTALGPATVTVTGKDGLVSIGTVQINNVAPGLFTFNSNGQGVVVANARRFRNGQEMFPSESVAQLDAQNHWVARPIDLGPATDLIILELYGTGVRFHSDVPSAVTMKIGGADAQLYYAGVAPGFIGLDQINVAIPRSLIGRGEVDMVMTVDGKTANTVKIAIK